MKLIHINSVIFIYNYIFLIDIIKDFEYNLEKLYLNVTVKLFPDPQYELGFYAKVSSFKLDYDVFAFELKDQKNWNSFL